MLSNRTKEKIREDLKNNKEGAKEALRLMSPEQIFAVFDEDDSGLITFNEFRRLLPHLNIHVNDAKALRYFRLCDEDLSGSIDVDEFRVMLYICDPNGGNEIGFEPGNHVSALDAFELFDENRSGTMDEDEFVYAMEYLGIKLSDESCEKIFSKYDVDGKGVLQYEQFREIYLNVCDPKQELEDRGIDIGSLTSQLQLRNLLRKVVMEEDERELFAIEETKKFKSRLSAKREIRFYTQHAKFRAYAELRSALDLAGQLYVFGDGNNGQFGGDVSTHLSTTNYEFQHFDKIIEIWRNRVFPQQLVDMLHQQRVADEHERRRELDRKRRRGEEGGFDNIFEKNNVLDPYIEAKKSLFHKLNVCVNTAGLYGRRIHDVAVSESVIFAVSDTGEVFSWGGRGHFWHEIQPDSIYQTKWRGDTTPRSQLLLGTTEKPITFKLKENTGNIQSFMSPDDKKEETIKVVTKYYNVWEPPPNLKTKMQYFEKVLMSKLVYDDLKLSLEIRGREFKVNEILSKMKLVEDLYYSISLEKKLLGERAHDTIKSLEAQIKSLRRNKKDVMADKIKATVVSMWKPLKEEQENLIKEIESKEEMSKIALTTKRENDYKEWRGRLQQNRESIQYFHTPRGNSLQITVSGITPRANQLNTPRSYQFASTVAAGASHVCLLHKNGQLYTWGVGTSGKLGLDLTENGDPQTDVSKPTLVQAFFGKFVTKVACGSAHTASVVNGELWMWGNASSGALGIGPIVKNQECYCSIPTKIVIRDKRIRKVSCGSLHTAVVTETGQLYVYGCNDGGRLGLGHFDPVFEPTLVSKLLDEKISSVSCGNSTTIAITEIVLESSEEVESKSIIQRHRGGNVYVAGSSNSLGKDYHSFTLLNDMVGVPIKQVSTGFRHNALISVEGELYCWGYNGNGCCGVDPSIKFVYKPTVVECLYSRPKNIALGKTAYQSSTFNNRDASYAVDGDRSGMGLNRCSCTQEDDQAWLEIDLGYDAIISEIWIWNRADKPKPGLAGLAEDFFTSRLFPLYVMIGRKEFDKGTSMSSLNINLSVSVAKMKFNENQRLCKWRCPSSSIGRFVRIQLKDMNYLNVAQVEVYGWPRDEPRVGRVSKVVAGRDTSAVVLRPSTNANEIDAAYKRAAYADILNVEIIRQYETYIASYDKFGRQEAASDSINNTCYICKGFDKCEICILKDQYHSEIETLRQMNKSGVELNLDDICTELMKDNFVQVESDEVVLLDHVEAPTPLESPRSLSKFFTKKFGFLNWFRSKDRITVDEALAIDPRNMYQTIVDKNVANAQSQVNVFSKSALFVTVDHSSTIKNESGKATSCENPNDGLNAIAKSSLPRAIGKSVEETYAIPKSERVNLLKRKKTRQ